MLRPHCPGKTSPTPPPRKKRGRSLCSHDCGVGPGRENAERPEEEHVLSSFGLVRQELPVLTVSVGKSRTQLLASLPGSLDHRVLEAIKAPPGGRLAYQPDSDMASPATCRSTSLDGTGQLLIKVPHYARTSAPDCFDSFLF